MKKATLLQKSTASRLEQAAGSRQRAADRGQRAEGSIWFAHRKTKRADSMMLFTLLLTGLELGELCFGSQLQAGWSKWDSVFCGF